jgi:hypothetical protein
MSRKNKMDGLLFNDMPEVITRKLMVVCTRHFQCPYLLQSMTAQEKSAIRDPKSAIPNRPMPYALRLLPYACLAG